MILIERLLVHQIGAIKNVDLRFAAMGTHILRTSVEEALGIREALRFALFGDSAIPSDRRPGGYAALSIVVGGITYIIERQIGDDRMVTTRLGRSGPKGLVQITEASRIDRELDNILGPNITAFESLIWPIGNFDKTARRLPDVMRAWLGTRRMHLLDAHVEISPDMKETEKAAKLHLRLAEIAQDHKETSQIVKDLDLALKRDRVWRAIQQVEKADQLITSSRETHTDMEILAKKFSHLLDDAARSLEVMQLFRHRDAAISRVKSAQSRQSGHERKLSELHKLKLTVSELERKLDTLDRILAAYTRSENSAAAAKKAREQIDSISKELNALESTRNDLRLERRRLDRLSLDATRAQTLTGRAHEEIHLPNATRLWDLWVKSTSEIDALNAIDEQELAHNQELNQVIVKIRDTDRSSRSRAQQRGLATVGTIVGTAIAGLGLGIAAPLVPVGLLVGILSTTTGLWLNISHGSLKTRRSGLIGRRSQLQYALRKIDHGKAARINARQSQGQAVSALREIDMEVPSSIERAMTLRDSATARLRKFSLGDERRDADELKAAYSSAASALSDAQNEVLRLEAREEALTDRQIEYQRTVITADLKTQLEKSAEAQHEIESLAGSLSLKKSREVAQAAQIKTTQNLHKLRDTINTQAELELDRQVSVRDQTRATSEVVRIEEMIGPRHMQLERNMTGESARRDRATILAEFVASLGEIGSKRSLATAHAASIRERSARSAFQRHTTDLANSLRSLGVETRMDPTSAEARAAVPTPTDQPANLQDIRTSLRRARESAKKTEKQLQTLELRTGIDSSDINSQDAKRRLTDIVLARRAKEIGQVLTSKALTKTLAGIPAAVEHTYRAALPLVTNGHFWDVRLDSDFAVELWDSSRNIWLSLDELDDDQKCRAECTLALSFASAAPPLDATDLPAFLWLEQNESDHDGSLVTALANTACQGETARRYRQLIVVLRPDMTLQPHFEYVSQVATKTNRIDLHNTISHMRQAG